MYSLLRNEQVPKMEDVETAFQGNLCRCTGYRPILEGYKTLTSDGMGNTVNGTNGSGGCCGKMANGCCKQDGIELCGMDLFESSEFKPFDPTQEPIFPPELKVGLPYS